MCPLETTVARPLKGEKFKIDRAINYPIKLELVQPELTGISYNPNRFKIHQKIVLYSFPCTF